ncbi:MAG: redoxin domain-containing protein [Chloroflexi bacterium]|nr:redoxin domain-containing protein [Chloroflexota bacterium]
MNPDKPPPLSQGAAADDEGPLGQPELASAFKARFRLNRRERVFLPALALLGLCAVALWRPLQQRLLLCLVLRSDAPAPEVVNELADHAKHPGAVLTRLWETQKIPHRLLALDYLKTHARSNTNAFPETEYWVVAANRDGDLEARELAVDLLSRQRHPALLEPAKEQLADADPAARVLALNALRQVGRATLSPLVVPLLDDPDPRVVVAADAALRKWTGQDFGLRISQAVPRFHYPDALVPLAAPSAELTLGVKRWQEWWQVHSGDYPKPVDERCCPHAAWRLPTKDFALENLAGGETRLSDLSGKAVLLSFWDSITPGCQRQLAVLNEVHQRNGQRLTALGISLENSVDERDHAKEHSHEHHAAAPVKPDVAQIRAHLQHVVEERRIQFPILLDTDGRLARRFQAQLLPTYVLIGPDGSLRRRFIGERPAAVFAAMLSEMEKETVHP